MPRVAGAFPSTPSSSQSCRPSGTAFAGTDYRFLRYFPVKATDWAVIEWACQQGFRRFDFLQSHVKNDGLRWYKRSFGAVESLMTYHYYPNTGSVFRAREALIGGR